MATGLALVDAGLRVTWLNPALAERLAPPQPAGQSGALMFADDAAVLAQARRALTSGRCSRAAWR
jgi:two-component system nitrogen regulation sensor histidine kinase GlnL